ncbi:hypothetical protein [Klebsiella phage phi731]|nr:hypothetical protein [Klebsiella phage phi731]
MDSSCASHNFLDVPPRKNVYMDIWGMAANLTKHAETL